MPVVDKLNARFAAGRPSDNLRSAGILIHQFDGRDDPNPDGTPWMPQRNDATSISAALVNKALEPEQDRHNVPVYSYSLAGLILDPQHNKVRCSYAFDVGSVKWKGACNKRRCQDHETADGHGRSGCAFNPSALQQMLTIQQELRRRGWKPPYKAWDDHKCARAPHSHRDRHTFMKPVARSTRPVCAQSTTRSSWTTRPLCAASRYLLSNTCALARVRGGTSKPG